MKLKILTFPNPILFKKSKKITIIDDEIKGLARDMAETLASYGSEHEIGAALAAIQVGVPVRMTVIRNDDGTFSALINPEIVKSTDGYFEDIEGCMSVPQKYGKVKRYKKIKVRGKDLYGKKIEIKAEGLLARILQHEIDHLDGILFVDHLSQLKRDLYKRQLKKEKKEGKKL